MKLEDITVIIPMHEFNKENIELVNKAIESVPDGIKVILSHKKGIAKKDLKGIDERVVFLGEGEGDSFAELVNIGVDNIDTKWFSILEFDDTYSSIWFDNVIKEIGFKSDVSVFMPLEDITDFNNKSYIGFGNEAAWASAFSNEIGYLDNECLQNYFDFYLTGSIFNTSDWREVGGLKPSIKITFWYEWLLRLTNKGKKVYVVPKVGYNHKLGRKGSLIEQYQTTIDPKESQWWFELAKREYLFKEDRKKEYNSQESETEDGD